MDDSPDPGLVGALLGAVERPMLGAVERPMLGAVERPMLVAAPFGDRHASSKVSKLRVLEIVGRRSLPSLIEATVIPAILFYVFFTNIGPTAAMLAVLSWSYGAMLRRLVGGHGVPGSL